MNHLLKLKYSFWLSFALIAMASCKEPQDEQEIVQEEAPKIEMTEPKPSKNGDFEQNLIDQGLVNIQEVAPEILVDLKYSTTDNFFKKDVYEDLTKAYAPSKVAKALLKANESLMKYNTDWRLIVFDAVRPHNVQYILWQALDSIPKAKRKAFVADPEEGSLHNYGCAIDLSIFDLKGDSLVDMGTHYDYFGDLAYPRKEAQMLAEGKLVQLQIENRQVLRDVMAAAGFTPITSEWWHFNFTSLQKAKRDFKLIK